VDELLFVKRKCFIPFSLFSSFFRTEKYNGVEPIFNQGIIHSFEGVLNKDFFKKNIYIIYIGCGNVDEFTKDV